MQEGQSLGDISAAIMSKLSSVLDQVKPDLLLVQGDTTTAFIASLSAFYKKIKVGHIEAGLRSYSKDEPYPEEVNRCLISKIADLHFAPTELNRAALIREAVPSDSIYVTGNTVIDALLMQLKKLPNSFSSPLLEEFYSRNTRKILVTVHRRENFGSGIESICKALNRLTEIFEDIEILFPVHPNPNVNIPIQSLLGNNSKICLIEPLGYVDFIQAMSKSYLIITDSGGLQEEAPSLGKPVLVLRKVTERPEAVEAGTVKLIGTDSDNIINESSLLLSDSKLYKTMANRINPYGDGKASKRIVDIIDIFLRGRDS
jgi:UDP-N-acetylglucosamine 2-epimerase (non-hydrolysing)